MVPAGDEQLLHHLEGDDALAAALVAGNPAEAGVDGPGLGGVECGDDLVGDRHRQEVSVDEEPLQLAAEALLQVGDGVLRHLVVHAPVNPLTRVSQPRVDAWQIDCLSRRLTEPVAEHSGGGPAVNEEHPGERVAEITQRFLGEAVDPNPSEGTDPIVGRQRDSRLEPGVEGGVQALWQEPSEGFGVAFVASGIQGQPLEYRCRVLRCEAEFSRGVGGENVDGLGQDARGGEIGHGPPPGGAVRPLAVGVDSRLVAAGSAEVGVVLAVGAGLPSERGGVVAVDHQREQVAQHDRFLEVDADMVPEAAVRIHVPQATGEVSRRCFLVHWKERRRDRRLASAVAGAALLPGLNVPPLPPIERGIRPAPRGWGRRCAAIGFSSSHRTPACRSRPPVASTPTTAVVPGCFGPSLPACAGRGQKQWLGPETLQPPTSSRSCPHAQPLLHPAFR